MEFRQGLNGVNDGMAVNGLYARLRNVPRKWRHHLIRLLLVQIEDDLRVATMLC